MGDVAAVSVQEMSEEFSHLTEKGIAKDKGITHYTITRCSV
jgi:predicted transcriptional regulator